MQGGAEKKKKQYVSLWRKTAYLSQQWIPRMDPGKHLGGS